MLATPSPLRPPPLPLPPHVCPSQQMGGPDKAFASSSPFETASLIPRSMWAGLREAQRGVLLKYGMSAAKLGLDPASPWVGSPFELDGAMLASGKTSPMLRQLALIACIEDDVVLGEVAKTGKLGSAGVEPADVTRCIVRWAAAHVAALADPSPALLSPQANVTGLVGALVPSTNECSRLAMRVAHAERACLLKWIEAMKGKLAVMDGGGGNGQGGGGGGGGLGESLAAMQSDVVRAEKKHKAALERLKAAVKEAAAMDSEGGGGAGGGEAVASGAGQPTPAEATDGPKAGKRSSKSDSKRAGAGGSKAVEID